ncbi:hypothetical protein B0H13DRAFT_1873708 [Mycena leptocephala]|nr:hypothetical protein B0H13DRAFT_1873708 [Mycena leptocephala]
MQLVFRALSVFGCRPYFVQSGFARDNSVQKNVQESNQVIEICVERVLKKESESHYIRDTKCKCGPGVGARGEEFKIRGKVRQSQSTPRQFNLCQSAELPSIGWWDDPRKSAQNHERGISGNKDLPPAQNTPGADGQEVNRT